MFFKKACLLVTLFQQISCINHKRELKVMISQRIPFITYQNQSSQPKGLDILILEHFAKTHNFQIEYVKSNESLHEVSKSNKRMNDFFIKSNKL